MIHKKRTQTSNNKKISLKSESCRDDSGKLSAQTSKAIITALVLTPSAATCRMCVVIRAVLTTLALCKLIRLRQGKLVLGQDPGYSRPLGSII